MNLLLDTDNVDDIMLKELAQYAIHDASGKTRLALKVGNENALLCRENVHDILDHGVCFSWRHLLGRRGEGRRGKG